MKGCYYKGIYCPTEDDWYNAENAWDSYIMAEALAEAEELADSIEWDDENERYTCIDEAVERYLNDEDWLHEKSLRW